MENGGHLIFLFNYDTLFLLGFASSCARGVGLSSVTITCTSFITISLCAFNTHDYRLLMSCAFRLPSCPRACFVAFSSAKTGRVDRRITCLAWRVGLQDAVSRITCRSSTICRRFCFFFLPSCHDDYAGTFPVDADWPAFIAPVWDVSFFVIVVGFFSSIRLMRGGRNRAV